MSTPEGLDNRRKWAELYRVVAIQASSAAEYLSVSALKELKDDDLDSFSILSRELGANLEIILSHLYKAYGLAYGISGAEFALRGGFETLGIHKHGEEDS